MGQQITALSDGGWVVTWSSEGQDGSGYGVYQQAYNSDGSANGVETKVNTFVEGNQSSPQVTALADADGSLPGHLVVRTGRAAASISAFFIPVTLPREPTNRSI